MDCCWIKLNDINKTRDEISAQAFAGYAVFQNLCVGGQTEDGRDATNPLTYMCMEATAHVRLPQPSFSIRVWQGTPDEFLYRACELVRLGLGVPAMYNDEVIIPALKGALDANFGYPVGGNPHSAAAKSSLGEQDIYEVVKRIIDRHGSLNPAEIKNEVYRQLASVTPAPSAGNPRYDEIRHILENSPCFGNDIDDVDLVARQCALIYCQRQMHRGLPDSGAGNERQTHDRQRRDT